MKIKVNDNIKVLTGNDKDKTIKVLKTLKNKNKVVVEGINISKRPTKPRANNDKDGILDIEMSIQISNVKLVDVKAEKKETKAPDKKSTKKPSK